MTAPVWRSAGTVAKASGDTTLTPGLPSGYQANDILVMTYNGFTRADYSTPSGWTELTSSPRTDVFGGFEGVCWKRASASETAPSVVSAQMARIHAISGCITTGSPVDASAVTDQSGSSTSAVSATGITTTAADDMIFVYVCAGNTNTTVSGWTNSNLVSLTERTDDGTTPGFGLASATGSKTTAGAIGTTTATLSSAQFPVTWVFGLKAGSSTSTVNGADNSTNVIETTNIVATTPAADVSGATADTAVAAVTVTGADASGLTGDLAGGRVADSDAISSNESMRILSGGATLVFASDVALAAEGVGPMAIKGSDTMSAPDALQSATLGIQGPLPPGPRIVRIGQST